MKKLGLWLMALSFVVCSSIATAGCFGFQTQNSSSTESESSNSSESVNSSENVSSSESESSSESSNSIVLTQDFIEISKSKISMEVYSQYTLTAITNVNEAVIWTTSDEAIATVENGVISAHSVGDVTITATAGEVEASCIVTVTKLSSLPVLKLERTDVALAFGGSAISVNVEVLYKNNPMDCEIVWESADESVVTVENGRITPIGIGETKITVSTVCLGEILVETISVRVSPDEQIQLSRGLMSLAMAAITPNDITSDSFTFEAFKEGEPVVDVTFTVESSDENVATVSVEGNEVTVTAVGAGECVVTVFYVGENGKISASVEVEVYLPSITIEEPFVFEYEEVNPTKELAFDIPSLNLVGEFEGVYYEGALISDGNKLTREFIDVNKGSSEMAIELRTSLASYSAMLTITITYPEFVVAYEEINPDKELVVDVSSLNLPGEFVGIYYKGELVSEGPSESAKLTTDFVAENMGTGALRVEIRTDAFSCIAKLTILVLPPNLPDDSIPDVSKGDANLPIGTYEGDVTAIGYPEGTGTIYVVEGAPYVDGDNTTWDNRIIMKTDPRLDYIKFDVSFSTVIDSFIIWPSTKEATVGSYSVLQSGVSPSADADQNRKVFIVDKEGIQANSFNANTVYTVYVYLNDYETEVQLNAFADVKIYVSNIECANGDVSPITTNMSDNGASAVPSFSRYMGDVTALGFAEGTVVWESKSATGTGGTWNDGVYMRTAAGSTCTTVNFSISAPFAAGSQLRIFAWFGNEANGWISAIINGAPSDISASLPRNVELLDAEGNPVSAWEVGKVYTLKIYHEGATSLAICVDETTVDTNFSIYYDNNVIHSNEGGSGTPDTPPVQPDDALLKSPSGDELAVYAGNVTEIGFAEGSKVQYIATQDLVEGSEWWHTGQEGYPGTEANLHRQEGIPSIPAKTGYAVVSIEFALSTAIASGDVFHVWAYDADATHLGGGVIAVGAAWAATGYAAAIFDTNGNIATSLEANTVYVLKLRMDGAARYSVANIVFAGMTTYFSASSLAYENEEVGVLESKPTYSTDGGHANETLPTYEGDVTDFGFAEGTEVFVQTISNGWNDRIIYDVDSTYDYVDIQFVGGSVAQIFIWTCGMDGNMTVGNYILNSDGTITLQAGGPNQDINPPQREIYILGANGKILSTAWEAGKVYTLRVYIEELTKVQFSNFASVSTFYYSTATFGNGTTEPDTDEPGPNPDVPVTEVSQGDNRNPMPTYAGVAADLGFPAGTETVYEIVTTVETAWNDRAVIDVDSSKDYVKFNVMFSTKVNANLTLWPANSNGTLGSYALSASGVSANEGADANRKVFIVDQDGDAITSFEANTLYTVYFYLNGDETSVQFGLWANTTIYLANIVCADGDVNPGKPISVNIFTQDKVAPLPVYKGDVTALGFAAGTEVVECTTTGDTWTDAAYFDTDETTNCLTVKFSLSSVFASGSQFRIYAWFGGDNHGWIASIIDCAASDNMVTLPKDVLLLNEDGTPVTEWEVGKVYTLKIYHGGAVAVAINVDQTTANAGFCVYYDNAIVENNDEYVEPELPDPTPDPEPTAPIVSGEATSTALTVYDGSVTELGFAEGTTVYQLVSAGAWNDRVKVAADPTCKYLDVQFSVASGPWYFNVWVCTASGMLDGSYLVNENTSGYAPHFPNAGTSGGNTKIQVLDASGNVVTGVRSLGTVYTLRVWLETESVTEIQIGQDNITMYFGNVESTDKEPVKLIAQGNGALPTYNGDVTALGFEEGTLVQYMVTETMEDVWNGNREPISGKSREELAAKIFAPAGKYVTVQFVVSEDIASGSVFYVWGMLGSNTHTQNGGVSFTSTTHGRILDVNGNAVTSLTKNTVYVLELYIEGTDTYKVANICNTGMELYFATESITYSDTSIQA